MKFTQRLRLFWTTFSTGVTGVTLGFLVIHHFYPHLGVRLLVCFVTEIFASALIAQLLLVGRGAWPLWVRRLSCLLLEAWAGFGLLGLFGYVRAETVWRVMAGCVGGALIMGVPCFWLADRIERRRIARINEKLARMQGRGK